MLMMLATTQTGCVSGRVQSSAELQKVIPQSWKPEWTDQAFLDEILPDLQADQAQLTVRSAIQARAADAQLFWAYIRLWEVLDQGDRIQLYHEQNRWLKARPAEAHRRNEYTDGSISAMSYNLTCTEVTLERVKVLDRRYRKASGPGDLP